MKRDHDHVISRSLEGNYYEKISCVLIMALAPLRLLTDHERELHGCLSVSNVSAAAVFLLPSLPDHALHVAVQTDMTSHSSLMHTKTMQYPLQLSTCSSCHK